MVHIAFFMPIPSPSKGEEEQHFVSRCVKSSVMTREFPDKQKRLAICYKQFRKKDGMDMDTIDVEKINQDRETTPKERIHIDRADAPTWMSSKFEKTDGGYLKGRAIITNIGVFTYTDSNGNTSRELRLPEEVFSRESLDSFRMLPITLDHPSEMVTAENIKQYQIGYTGDNPSSMPVNAMDSYLGEEQDWKGMRQYSDGFHLANDMLITDAEAIESIVSGKTRELSAAYVCDLEMAEPGSRWCGIDYDSIQRNIRYNHVAVVDRARAGDQARIRLDSADAQQILIREEVPRMDLKKINLDGVEYQAESEVLKSLNQHKERADQAEKNLGTAKTSLSEMQAERDTLSERCDQLQEKIKEMEQSHADEAEIESRVQELLEVRSVAQDVGVEIKKDSSKDDLMRTTILKRFPNADLKDKDEVYIRSRFDAVKEILQSEGDSTTRAVGSTTPVDHGDSQDSAETARQNMIKRYRGGKTA